MTLRQRLVGAVVACGAVWVLLLLVAMSAVAVTEPEPVTVAFTVGALCAAYLVVQCVGVDVSVDDGTDRSTGGEP